MTKTIPILSTHFVSLSRQISSKLTIIQNWRVAKNRQGGRFEMNQSEETFLKLLTNDVIILKKN